MTTAPGETDAFAFIESSVRHCVVGTTVMASPTRVVAQGAIAPMFEVASVKPNRSTDPAFSLVAQPGGRITANNIPVRELILAAYGIQPFQLVDVPAWVNAERFDVQAKAPEGFSPTELPAMMKSLLADRFHLVVRSETRELLGYALMLIGASGSLGPHLTPSTTDCSDAARAARATEPPPTSFGNAHMWHAWKCRKTDCEWHDIERLGSESGETARHHGHRP